MSNKQQPPIELVEKFKELNLFSFNNHSMTDMSSKCTQIAVDYAEEENRELKKQYEPLSDLLHCLTSGHLGVKLPKYRRIELHNAIMKFEKQLLNK